MAQVKTEATTTTKPTILDIETLNEISTRLYDRAESINQICLQDLTMELRLAARVCSTMASLRFRIAEIAQNALDHPEWDRAAFARDLRDMLNDAEF